MKLKSKDVIILKLIEETEHMWDFMQEDNDELQAMGRHGCDAKHCCQGRIDILKWVLCIDELDNEINKEI